MIISGMNYCILILYHSINSAAMYLAFCNNVFVVNRFSPAIFFFLISIIPSLWILELHNQDNKSTDFMVFYSAIYCLVFSQFYATMLCRLLSCQCFCLCHCSVKNLTQLKTLGVFSNSGRTQALAVSYSR